MKKTEDTLHEGHIKLLHKKYKILDKPNVETLYGFCQNDFQKTQKILIVAKDIPNPYHIIRILQQRPQKAQEFLANLQNRYDKEYGHLNKEKKTQYQQPQTYLQFFKHLPVDACLIIFTYLDPYSFDGLSKVSKKMNKISQHTAMTQYYRKVCSILFPIGLKRFPNPCRFTQVRKYVLENQGQFSPNTKNAVLNNLQHHVWKNSSQEYEHDKQYYLGFGSYENIFTECPRIHFNGYYMCKHRYLKQEEKKLLEQTANSYMIQYYRYFRFFSDGSLLLFVSSNKVKEEKLIENLGIKNLQNQKIEDTHEILIGQFRHYKDKLHVKVVKGNSIFNYQLLIKNENGKSSKKLVLMKYTLEIIDENEIIQILEENNGEKQELYFNYRNCLGMMKENPPEIRACSL